MVRHKWGVMTAEIDLKQLVGWIRDHWHVLLLVFILLFGAKLRAYHANYPVIGYHNWKEVHYLTEARNFAREGLFAHGFFVPAFDYPELTHDPSGAHSDSFPTISILVATAFKIIGTQLWMARWIGILFNLGAIIYTYLLVKQLFKRENLALTTAAVMAINPLLIFFSRNVQLESPALFFMIGAAYYGAKWHEHEGKRQLLLAAAFFGAAVLTRYDYALIALPLAFIFPWKRAQQLIFHPQIRYWWAIGALLLLVVPLWFWYSNYYLPDVLPGEQGGAVNLDIIDFSKPFEKEFWQGQKSYLADNFTIIPGIGMLIFGLAAFLALLKRNTGSHFMMGYILVSIPWFFLMADKLSGHSYHWFPIVPLFSFLVAFGFTVLGQTIEQLVKWKFVHIGIVLLLLIWLTVPSIAAANRQFNTQFFGLDIAGEYINAHSRPEERVFHSSHQSYGVLRHADRKGYKNPGTLAELQQGEQMNASWVFVYQWGFSLLQNAEVWGTIHQSYHPVQFAFVQEGDNLQPFYLLLKKGGTFDEEVFAAEVQKAPLRKKAYELSDGQFTLQYVNLE